MICGTRERLKRRESGRRLSFKLLGRKPRDIDTKKRKERGRSMKLSKRD